MKFLLTQFLILLGLTKVYAETSSIIKEVAQVERESGAAEVCRDTPSQGCGGACR